MKFGHIAVLVCLLGLGSILLVNCGSSSPTSSNSATATPTVASTVVPAYNLSGTITWQGGGTNHVYALLTLQGSNQPVSISSALSSGGSYSFTGLTTPAELFIAYDATGNGLKLGGSNGVEQGNGASTTGSNDVVCLVGYTGACPNTQGASGTYYSTSSTVNVTFGGTTNSYAAGQSGSNCTQ